MKFPMTLLPLVLFVLLAGVSSAQNAEVMTAQRAQADFALTADPKAPVWKNAKGVFAERGPRGDVTPGHRTEIRALWTDKNLYLLFVCPYEELHLTANPATTTETNKLWEWDVAEVFIGSDFQNIKHYTEFQVSPQGEWVDLDIDRTTEPAKHDWQWNSGYEVKAHLVKEQKVWYGAMRIPFDKIDQRAPKAGNELRINFYRLQGPPPNRKGIAWQPTKSNSYHVPEAFGLMRLGK